MILIFHAPNDIVHQPEIFHIFLLDQEILGGIVMPRAFFPLSSSHSKSKTQISSSPPIFHPNPNGFHYPRTRSFHPSRNRSDVGYRERLGDRDAPSFLFESVEQGSRTNVVGASPPRRSSPRTTRRDAEPRQWSPIPCPSPEPLVDGSATSPNPKHR